MIKEKKLLKIVMIIVLILLLLSVFQTQVKAGFIEDIISKGKDFIGRGNDSELISGSGLVETFVPIARALVTVGTVVLVIVTTIIGVKYFSAGPEEQAKLKQQLIGLVVATVVIFGGQVIWSILYNFLSEI